MDLNNDLELISEKVRDFRATGPIEYDSKIVDHGASVTVGIRTADEPDILYPDTPTQFKQKSARNSGRLEHKSQILKPQAAAMLQTLKHSPHLLGIIRLGLTLYLCILTTSCTMWWFGTRNKTPPPKFS